jgi:hypothetical protein
MGISDFFAKSSFGNPPAVERILELIWQLQDACEEQTWRDHWHEEEPNCPCIFCEHTNGLWYNLRSAEAVFEGQVRQFPNLLRRYAHRARESGDEQRAAELEARAAEKEANAGPVTTPPISEHAPHIVLLNQLRDSLEADAPLMVSRGPS